MVEVDDDIVFRVGTTVGVTLLFVLAMSVSEKVLGGRWGVLVSLVLFLVMSSVVGVLISRRAYSE
ncbi:MAG: hypothetical protein SV760_05060 [Halobacteria archaeon]|nr:hypothetical protein [Halobacteria archaeon]